MKKRPVVGSKASPIPEGFKQIVQVKSGSRHTYILCTKIVSTEFGKFPCSYRIRKDTLRKDNLEEALQHTCFTCSLDRFNISDPKKKVNEDKSPNEMLALKLAEITGKHALSLETAIGKCMKNLLISAIRIGQQYPTANIEDLLPSMNRRSFTKQLIKIGMEKYEEFKKVYLKYKFVSVNVVLFFVLCHIYEVK